MEERMIGKPTRVERQLEVQEDSRRHHVSIMSCMDGKKAREKVPIICCTVNN